MFDAGWSESEFRFAIPVSTCFNCINRLVQGHGIEYSATIGDGWETRQGLAYTILELDRYPKRRYPQAKR